MENENNTSCSIEEVYNYSYEDKLQIEDVKNRRLYLNCDIDDCNVGGIIYYIMYFNRIDKGIPVNERKPIILYINSPGGNVVDGYGIIDAIICSDTPVYTVNLALCASMGFLVYLAGVRRYAMPHSEFLMHDGSMMGYDSTAKMKDRMEFETIQIENMTKKYIMDRTKISEDLYNAKYRCEWYFLPEEGKKIGVVDYIIGKDCKLDEVI